jgi:hypothetical protein
MFARRLDADTKCAQRVEHALCVIGLKHVMDVRFTRGERREQQDAIGNTLGAGQPDAAAHGADGSEIKKFHAHSPLVSRPIAAHQLTVISV